MAKLLLIQSRTKPGSIKREFNNFTRALGGLSKLDALSALDERLAWTYPDEILKDYDGVMFGGSSDFDLHGGRDEKDPARIMAAIILSRVRMIVRYALAEEKPLFGVCFGHQLIAEMHGGEVRKDEGQGKRGAHEVVVNKSGKSDPVFGSVAESFGAHYLHNDSVTMLPKGATLLASGASCRFSALRYGQKVYTVQFHPEIQCACLNGSPEASRVIHMWLDRVIAS